MTSFFFSGQPVKFRTCRRASSHRHAALPRTSRLDTPSLGLLDAMFMQATATEHASLLGGGSKRYGAVAPPRSKIQQNGRRVGAALIVVCMIGVLALLTDHRPRTGDVALDDARSVLRRLSR